MIKTARHGQFLKSIRLCLILLGFVGLSACSTKPASTLVMPTSAPAGTQRTRPIDGAEMVLVPAGNFVMGSDREMTQFARQLCQESSGALAVATCQAAAFSDERPAHVVRLDGFWIDRVEVTNGQYEGCVTAGACNPPLLVSSFSRPDYYGTPAYGQYPVVNVLWEMAAQYCRWAGARLPTEAEWEYAARGPENRIFAWGSDFERSKLNYCDASCPLLSDKTYNDGYPDTAPIGSFPSGASWVGALDMTGNVREWVSDWLGPYGADSAVNPTGPDHGELKVTRGGSWYDTPDDVRGANRGGESLEYYRDNLGFRCVTDLE